LLLVTSNNTAFHSKTSQLFRLIIICNNTTTTPLPFPPKMRLQQLRHFRDVTTPNPRNHGYTAVAGGSCALRHVGVPLLRSFRSGSRYQPGTPLCNARMILLRREARNESSARNSVSCQSVVALRHTVTLQVQNVTTSFNNRQERRQLGR
jgi:hypothetical protein